MERTNVRTRLWKYLLATAIASAIALLSCTAFAGLYLNTSAMLLHENAKAGHWVRLFQGDKELARNAAKLAKARSEVAAKMNVPSEVHQAHPHLLLTLSAMEAAMQAAVDGKTVEFVRQLQTSTGEAKTFQAVLQTLGFSLPDYGRMAMHAPPCTFSTYSSCISRAYVERTSASSQALWRLQRRWLSRASNNASRLVWLPQLASALHGDQLCTVGHEDAGMLVA